MIDFWSFINGRVPGGIWLFIIPYFFTVGVTTFIYKSSDSMTLPRYVRSLGITTILGVLVYATLLAIRPALPLIPNVMITPVMNGEISGKNKIMPFFLSKILHRSYPSQIHIVDFETVNEFINTNKLQNTDSLLERASNVNIHFAAVVEAGENNKFSISFYDLRNGNVDLVNTWEYDGNRDVQDILVESGNNILSELYPEFSIEKSTLTQAITELFPDNESRLAGYVSLQKLFTGRNFKETIKLAESLIKSDTGFAHYYYYLGRAHFENAKTIYSDTLAQKNELILASNNLLDAVRRNQTNEDFLNELAEVYLDQGKFDEATDVVKAAYEIDPNHYKAYLNFGRLHKSRWYDFEFLNREKFLAQTNLVRRAIDLNPLCYQAYFIMGKFLESETESLSDVGRGRALDNFEKSLEINPNYIPAIEHTWKTYLFQLNFKRSKELYSKLVELTPQNPYTYFLQGMNFFKYGMSYKDNLKATNENLDSALKYFNINIAMNDNPNAHLYLGAIYDFRKDTVNAVKEFVYRIRNRESETDKYAITAYRRLHDLDYKTWRQINKEIPPLVSQDQ